MTIKLIITDLDNTLYDWVTFYSKSFDAMVSIICRETFLDKNSLLLEYRDIHRKYKNSEQPFATLDLPSIQRFFGTKDRGELSHKLKFAFDEFSRVRNDTLKLYPGVRETLIELKNKGVIIVGHTESFEYNSLYRLNKLGVLQFFKHIYTQKDVNNTHPFVSNDPLYKVSETLVKHLGHHERKPNPELLKHICKVEGFDVSEAIYVGDSLAKDISMAKSVNIKACWAEYGRTFDNSAWDILLKITHWDENDAKREKEISETYKNIRPDVTLSEFSDILNCL